MKDIDWLLKEKYHGEKTESFFADIKRLDAGEPLAYVIGHQPFLNTTIWLDSQPLIPRTETEFWIEKLISEIKQNATLPNKILDLCAGSGCIGVALSSAFPNAQLTFLEIDESHHQTIAKNCQFNNIPTERYTIVGGDLFTELTKQTFDLIVSNPPYIDVNLNRTATSVTEFEPALALFAQNAGLQILEKIIKDAPEYLTKNGQLWIEHEPEQVLPIDELAKKYFIVYTENDQFGIKRFSKLVLQ